MRLDGEPVAFADPSAANRAGIVCIFQELSLMPDLIGRRQHRHLPTRRAASA